MNGQHTNRRRAPRLLALCCGIAAAAAVHAATGFNVTPEQFGQIKQGMSRSEVLQALGKPAGERQYGNRAGVTWVYNLLSFGRRNVHIDFDVEGRVVATSTRGDRSGN
ncbi:outer membrane protein assembly factor BamE domain-containing protein [Piscinibacter sakaiensis]|uniref:outer membrane protein assembly factor BamE domain-containing protein n=1 Tax=Piscinibacter sakaiensis TaxID=1547922 RepID=UPI003AAA60AC